MQATACARARAAARSLWLPGGPTACSSPASSSKCVTSSIQHQQHEHRQHHTATNAGSSTSHVTSYTYRFGAAKAHRASHHSLTRPSIFLHPSSRLQRHYATSTSTHNDATLRQEATSIPPIHSGPAQAREYRAYKKQRRRYRAIYVLLGLGAAGVLSYHFVPPFRRGVIATQRIALVASAVLACIADYKILFWREWDDPAIRHRDYKRCHSAFRFKPGIPGTSFAKAEHWQ